MTKELVYFQHDAFGQVRIIEKNGEYWFVGQDIAMSLNYSISSTPAVLFQSVPDEWKGIKPIDTPGGVQDMICLTESGLYFFLGRSDKPKALPYQKWVAGEILPSIRRTGGYLSIERRVSLLLKLAKSGLPSHNKAELLAEAASLATGRPADEFMPPPPPDPEDLIEEAWAFVKDWCAVNADTLSGTASEIHIPTGILDAALTSVGLRPRAVIKAFAARRYVLPEIEKCTGKSRYTTRRRINGVQKRVYVIPRLMIEADDLACGAVH